MTEYIVKWEINADENTPLEAARFALKMQRDPESGATFFRVINVETKEETIIDFDFEKITEEKKV